MHEALFPEHFRSEIVKAIREELRTATTPQPTWLRSSQVKEMLNISDSTLQNLRINGTLPAYKLGTTWFYKHDEIVAALEAGRQHRKEADHEKQ
jgi:excisionase family DNA binding protein